MRIDRIAVAISTLALALTLAACAKSELGQVTLDEASGVKVTAENAKADNCATTEGAIVAQEGDVIVISPMTDKGSFHLTITSDDGTTTVFDDDVSGQIMFSIEAKPGSYTITTSGNDVTGWMTVFASNAEELAQQDAELAETIATVTGQSASGS